MANLFEELQTKKSSLISLAEKAAAFGWIESSRKQEIVDKINNDVLTIGVIGQMKCGKSTFLNAFVFEDDVLPAATTPMTAALSVITYGEQKRLVAEFYSAAEWEEQKHQAARDLESVKGNTLEESKIKAAQELVAKSIKLGSSLNDYLGSSKEDDLKNLEEYVGADGKFVCITKSVTIYYPLEYLKGVEIVDTPGFNDPIVSREERTKAFLNKADVVLLMLYAGRPFDATDRDILFNNVKQCGIGKVLIGVNKYDIPFANGDKESEIINYVKEEINKACCERGDDILNEIVRESAPIALSAGMALNAKMPLNKVMNNPSYKHMWDMACDIFEISTQAEMYDKSRINELIIAVKRMLEREKEKILLQKPLNAIIEAGNKKIHDIGNQLHLNEEAFARLNSTDDENEERLHQIERAKRRLERKIDTLEGDLENNFKKIIRQGCQEMEDCVDQSCKRMKSLVESVNFWGNYDAIVPRIKDELTKLFTRTLKREHEDLEERAVQSTTSITSTFFQEAQEVIFRYLPDVDERNLVQDIRNSIDLSADDEVFTFDMPEEEKDWVERLYDIENKLYFGALDVICNLWDKSDRKKRMLDGISDIANSFDPNEALQGLLNKKDFTVASIKEKFFVELLNPMEQQIDEILKDKSNKDAKLKEASQNVEKYKNDLNVSKEQMEEMKRLTEI